MSAIWPQCRVVCVVCGVWVRCVWCVCVRACVCGLCCVLCVCCVWCVCACLLWVFVCIREIVCVSIVNIWPTHSDNNCSKFFYPLQYIMCALSLFLFRCQIFWHFHHEFFLFLWFILTKMAGMLAPIPEPHHAVPTSKSGYVVDTAISKQPIQIEERPIWTARRLPHISIKMPLSKQPTGLVPK